MNKTIQVKKGIFLPLVAVLALVGFLGLRACTPQTMETESPQLPGGFVSINDPGGGTSRMLMAQKSQVSDVSALLQGTLDELRSYFKGTLKFGGGLQDKRANSALGTFTATIGNQSLQGIVFARLQPQLQPQGGTVQIIYDRTGALAKTLSRQIQSTPGSKYGGSIPGTGSGLQSPPDGGAIDPQSLRWNTIQFPDGSGSIELPADWSITEVRKGAIRARGPDDSGVQFGQALPIHLPGSMNTPGAEGLLYAYYAPPAQAIFTVNAEVSRVYGPRPAPSIEVVGQYQYPVNSVVSSPYGGDAAFLYFTTQTGEPRRLYRGLASVITLGQSQTSWLYYYSQIYAPDPIFHKYLPVMTKIWKSWKVSGKVYQQRLDEALANIRELRPTGPEVEPPTPTGDKAHANFIESIRNEGFIRDTNLDTIFAAPLESAQAYVENANRLDPGRYEVVPRRDLR